MRSRDEERAYRRLNRLRLRAAREAGLMPEAAHGTAGGYDEWGCRCAVCSGANTERHRAKRGRSAG